MNFEEWREAKKHLPYFMRDFHDQKRIFKYFDNKQQDIIDKNPEDLINKNLPNWIAAHIYTIDIFLHIMAAYGYTLQKTRKKFDTDYRDTDELIMDNYVPVVKW